MKIDAPELPAWRQDGKGVLPGGVLGGDIQAGPAHGVRFFRDDRPGAVIQVDVYACKSGDAGMLRRYGEVFVQVAAEFCLCDDRACPFDSEIWSDMRCYNITGAVTLAEAGRQARAFAGQICRLCPREIAEWDGESTRLPAASYPYQLTLA